MIFGLSGQMHAHTYIHQYIDFLCFTHVLGNELDSLRAEHTVRAVSKHVCFCYVLFFPQPASTQGDVDPVCVSIKPV